MRMNKYIFFQGVKKVANTTNKLEIDKNDDSTKIKKPSKVTKQKNEVIQPIVTKNPETLSRIKELVCF